MRLKSEIWVKAYVRRCNSDGAPAVVAHRGDAEAGTIIIKIARLDGTADVYVPAPAGLATDDGERRWIAAAVQIADRDADARLAAERRLDSDAWIIEVEDRSGRCRLDDWLVTD